MRSRRSSPADGTATRGLTEAGGGSPRDGGRPRIASRSVTSPANGQLDIVERRRLDGMLSMPRFSMLIETPAVPETRRAKVEDLGPWLDPDLNRGHPDFQSCALPTELSGPGNGGILSLDPRSQRPRSRSPPKRCPRPPPRPPRICATSALGPENRFSSRSLARNETSSSCRRGRPRSPTNQPPRGPRPPRGETSAAARRSRPRATGCARLLEARRRKPPAADGPRARRSRFAVGNPEAGRAPRLDDLAQHRHRPPEHALGLVEAALVDRRADRR